MATLAPPVERTRVCPDIDCPAQGKPQPYSNFYARERFPDGTIAVCRAYCKHCEKARAKRWQQANPEKRRAAWMASDKRRRNDPERHAARMEYLRTKNRERNGITPDRYRNSRLQVNPETNLPMLPAEPFARWLSTLDVGSNTLAMWAKVSDSILRRIGRDEQEWVAIDTVDRCAMAMGVRIEDIYGDD